MSKRLKQVGTISVILFLLGGCAALIMDKYVERVGSNYIIISQDVPKTDAILVLGAYVHLSGKVSTMLNDRLTVGYELNEQGKAKKIIVSGDHGQKSYDEVNAMKSFLIEKGVPSQDIFMDHAGFST